jgi:DNA-binding NarL/FixJ family response regulator
MSHHADALRKWRALESAYNVPSTESRMKILLVDDHVLFREGVSMLLQNLMTGVVIYEAGSSHEALSQVATHDGMDLILMDIGLPDASGIEVIGMMREKYPEIPVVALSSRDDKATVLSALDRGAMGFVPKSASSHILAGALRLILAHGIYLPPSVFLGDRTGMGGAVTVQGAPGAEAQHVAGADPGSGRAVTPADLGLTPRQAEVLYRILQGKPAKTISRELNLSASTVKTHTSAVLRSLNVTTRTQAIIAAGKLSLRF